MGAEPVDAETIARAHAVYTPSALAFYDLVVHGLSNRLAWRCPTSRLVGLYETNLSANHLEAGAGTGLFIDRAGTDFDRLVLLDINEHCLRRASAGGSPASGPPSARRICSPRSSRASSRSTRWA